MLSGPFQTLLQRGRGLPLPLSLPVVKNGIARGSALIGFLLAPVLSALHFSFSLVTCFLSLLGNCPSILPCMLDPIFVYLRRLSGHRFATPFSLFVFRSLVNCLENSQFILYWVFDAVLHHLSNVLENLNMLKHCACAVNSKLFLLGASTIFCFVL